MASQPTSTPAPGKIKLSLAARKPKPNTTTNGTIAGLGKRPHSLLSTDADTEDSKSHLQTSYISQFGAAPSQGVNGEVEIPRVIAPLVNKGWGRGNSNVTDSDGQEQGRQKRQKSGIPGHSQTTSNTDQKAAEQAALAEEARKPVYGLNVRQRSRTRSRSRSASPVHGTANGTQVSRFEAKPAPTNGIAQATQEQEALDRLTGKTSSAPGKEATIAPVAANEDEAFRTASAHAPREATLEEYQATPVEGFGAALMRGYLPAGETLESWKERVEARVAAGKVSRAGKGKKVKNFGDPPLRRKELLGLGATEAPELGLDKDAKGKKKSRREAMEYHPLARKNVVTGEVLGEFEYQERVEAGRTEGNSEDTRPITNGVNGLVSNGEPRKLLEEGDSREHDRDKKHDRHRDDYRDYRDPSDKDRRRDRERRYDDDDRRHRSDDRRHDDQHRDRDRDRDRDQDDHRSSRREHKHRDRSRERRR